MPYFSDNLDEDEDDQSGSVQISGASPTTDSSGAVSDSDKGKDLNTGSGYQNLDKYLTTNEPQAFGQQVLGKVGSEIDTVQDNLSNTKAASTTIASQNKTPETSQLNSALANPTAANNVDQWKGWQNQQYQGPNSVADVGDYQKLGASAQKAQTSAGLLGNEAGRFTLLDSYYGKPSYNFGEKSLDNLMLQNAGVGRQSQGLQNQVTSLKTQGNQAGKQLQSDISGTQAQIASSRANVRGAIGIDDNGQVLTGDKAGAIGQQWSAVDQAIASQNAARQAEYAQSQAAVRSGNITQAQAQAMGGLGNQNTYGLDLGSYLTAGNDLSKNQVMTSEQQANIRALSEMAGVTDTYAAGDLSAKSDPYSFNKAGYENDRNSRALEISQMTGLRPDQLDAWLPNELKLRQKDMATNLSQNKDFANTQTGQELQQKINKLQSYQSKLNVT